MKWSCRWLCKRAGHMAGKQREGERRTACSGSADSLCKLRQRRRSTNRSFCAAGSHPPGVHRAGSARLDRRSMASPTRFIEVGESPHENYSYNTGRFIHTHPPKDGHRCTKLLRIRRSARSMVGRAPARLAGRRVRNEMRRRSCRSSNLKRPRLKKTVNVLKRKCTNMADG